MNKIFLINIFSQDDRGKIGRKNDKLKAHNVLEITFEK
jgi:hypothetical protein